jgi:hypothetical protein
VTHVDASHAVGRDEFRAWLAEYGIDPSDVYTIGVRFWCRDDVVVAAFDVEWSRGHCDALPITVLWPTGLRSWPPLTPIE